MQMRAGMNGEALTVEKIDVDVSIPGLLRDLVGVTAQRRLLGARAEVHDRRPRLRLCARMESEAVGRERLRSLPNSGWVRGRARLC